MIKGLRDIKTHGSLDREGRLFGVAKYLRQEVKRNEFSEEEFWEGKVKSFERKRGVRGRRFSPDLFLDSALKKKIRAGQIEQLQVFIIEMEKFISEGINGAAAELESLKRRLGRWEEEG
ncbi:MAG: hypothetical protein A3C71_02950 [Candidatus Yanofskybacteria bacterium RIFCSPHIGHO2_02_FULL_43_15c]|uniref:Uncharacterized protein n=1 Tax=Candidatus Yanofskybacteria bacterium RIFCSPHIGHO2_02_FULL_43_15c TaxID=1802679 RepID=A0A1F8FH80_9BACT|nr:MAG: hypothetical protein A3C71_02950 [Candidatus Yanofskybacteria bacterium RIFCSPHIGHO2_02_FULL_43_15c]